MALDAGTAFAALFIFLVLDLPNARIDWWGNRVYQESESIFCTETGLVKMELIISGGLEWCRGVIVRCARNGFRARYLVDCTQCHIARQYKACTGQSNIKVHTVVKSGIHKRGNRVCCIVSYADEESCFSAMD